jgi:DNA-directed RNA polymerase subunit K/omega
VARKPLSIGFEEIAADKIVPQAIVHPAEGEAPVAVEAAADH